MTDSSDRRPSIAFFDYPDVFEDFYPHYDVDQETFASSWTGTGAHTFATVLQREVGDVVWYALSIQPKVSPVRHSVMACEIRFLSSSPIHRRLWRWFYDSRNSWRWRDHYRLYEAVASVAALASFRIWNQVRRNNPDVMFVQDYSTGRFEMQLLIAASLRIPLVAWHSGSRPERYVIRPLKRFTIRRAALILASSRTEKRMLEQRFGVDPQRVRVVLTPVDTNFFRPRDRDETRSALGLPREATVVLFVGRLYDRLKRVGALIDVWKSVTKDAPHAHLILVGDGPDRQMLEERAAGVARVTFVGWMEDRERLAQMYAAADLMVLPSLSEGFPTAVGEAMASGTPVLASDVGGVAELVRPGETGWLVPPGDNEALHTTLVSVLGRNDLSSFRPRARGVAEELLSPDRVANGIREVLRATRDG